MLKIAADKKYNTALNFLKIFIILSIAHMTLTEDYFIAFAGVALSFVASYILYLRNKDLFGFVVFIFAGSHFIRFGPGHGGAMNHIAFLGLALNLALVFAYKEVRVKKPHIGFLLLIFIAWNVLGWIFKSPVMPFKMIFGISALFSFVLVFYFLSNVKLTPWRLKLFIEISAIMSLWALLVSFNTYLKLINTISPFLVSTTVRFENEWFIQSGTFSNHELYGEYGMLSFFLFLSISFSERLHKIIDNRILWIGIISSFFNAVFSFGKAVIVEITIGTILLLVFNNLLNIKMLNQRYNFVKYAIILVAILLILQPVLPVQEIFSERFSRQKNIFQNFLEDPITAQNTSREQSYTMGLKRITSHNWLIGYGWAVGSEQRKAWFDNPNSVRKADFHNLYYSGIPIFGWIGMAAFVILILTVIRHSFKIVISFRQTEHYLIPVATGFIFVFFFFLIDQWKINATRDAHYFMMIWIWLGIAVSTIRTIRQDMIGR